MSSTDTESADNESSSTMAKTTVYNIKFFFRGRQIAEECEPPADLIDDFLDFVANGILHCGWDQEREAPLEHNHCTEDCAIETCLVFGWPYTISVRDSIAA